MKENLSTLLRQGGLAERSSCSGQFSQKTGLTGGHLVGIPIIVIPSISAIALRALTVETVKAGSVLQREAGRLFRAFSVSAAQFNVINLLAGRPGGVRASELALSLVVDPSSTTYILDQLEERSLITRKRDTEDRRALNVLLTPSGKRLHAKLIPVYHRALQRMAESFTAEELAGALPFLEKLPAAAVEAIDSVLAESALVRTGKPKKTKRGGA
jgi:DNA-binding MarR family transcriptional regulator